MKFMVLSVALLSFAALANEPSRDGAAVDEAAFLQSLKPQSGNITLPDGVAVLQLGDNFQYLSPQSAEKLLVDAWGNPPGQKTLGMIIPNAVSPLADDGWGVVVSYDEGGYISDEDADDIDYAQLLDDMKAATADANKERKAGGYVPIELVGWAEPPSYDRVTHKFYWAKELATADAPDNVLNYDIRILGRKGALELRVVAGMAQLPAIKAQIPELLAMTNFTEGHRYQDFNADTDHVAEYGLAALVAGGVAAKTGLFAKLAALFIAFKKIFIFVIVAVVGLGAKLLGRKSDH